MSKTTLTMSLHDAQEFNHDLGGRADEDLALSPTLGIDNVVEAIVLANDQNDRDQGIEFTDQNRDSDHFCVRKG